MFRTVPLSIISSFSLYTQQRYMSYRLRLAGAGWNCSSVLLLLIASCQRTCMTYTVAVCTVKNCWWWTEELSETCSFIPKINLTNQFIQLVLLWENTSYVFRCLLHDLQADHCLTCSRTVFILLCCCTDCAVKRKVRHYLSFFDVQCSKQHVTTLQKSIQFWSKHPKGLPEDGVTTHTEACIRIFTVCWPCISVYLSQ
jgi:hypothetical protein